MTARTDTRRLHQIQDRVAAVRENVASALERAGRGPDEVRLLVAAKYYGTEEISALAEAGVELLGENRLQDLVGKQEIFGDRFRWHFIGHLQRRKAKDIVGRVDLIHSVDSARLVEELEKRASGEGVEDGIDVLLQVNVSGEDAKYGVAPGEVERLLEVAAEGENVRVRGFMTLAPAVEDAEDVRYVFAELRELREKLRRSWSPRFDLSELSMGMSNDYGVAVEEGATIVRIGRILLGENGP